ncbi:MAG: phosphatidylglycerophosphatase A [Candidatus Marinimicrobia bacterium]|nr:phosphatidylglycerophosphatase A [Candidatus Neomarinimicrobiota bacterium]|tara:strand:+ start:6131 stop:6565 length:435 start_codon:yes stop_codon:yes gene_type:complete
MNLIYKFTLTFFGAGYIKYAPGSIASLLSMIIWYFIPNHLILQLLVLFLILLLSIFSCYKHSAISDIKDPSYIVIDEVLGMSISLFLLPKHITLYLLAFIIFRVFDILKPSIIYNIQDLDNGIGIIADDMVAGLFTFIILYGMI